MKKIGRPKMPEKDHMVVKTFSIPPELWAKARQVANENSHNMSALIRNFLKDYIAKHEKK